MKNNPWLAVILLLYVGYSPCLGDDGSARRYAEFAEVAEYDDTFQSFLLLERKEVQKELGMSTEQTARVTRICHASDQDVPGLLELMAQYRKRQSDSTISTSDQEKPRESFKSDVKNCIDAYQRKELSATLSANQRQRLSELVMQMRGPIVFLEETVSSRLQLSSQQKEEMKATVKDYDGELKWLQGRYGRQQIKGIHKYESLADRQEELQALFVVIRAIERERDANLLVELTAEQATSWATIRGRLFPIAWPPTSVSDFPFGEQK
jgi:hypothetical protein